MFTLNETIIRTGVIKILNAYEAYSRICMAKSSDENNTAIITLQGDPIATSSNGHTWKRPPRTYTL